MDRMLELVRSFPSLRAYPGVAGRFDPSDFETWSRGGHATGGSRYASQFILEVWNGYSGSPRKCPWKIGRFSLRNALGTWDRGHFNAFAAWVNDPNRVLP